MKSYQVIEKRLLNGAVEEIWGYLKDDEKSEIIENLEVKTVKRGEIIYNNNDKVNYIFAIIKGCIKVEIEGVAGRYNIVQLIKHDNTFGYQDYFADKLHRGRAVALEKSIIVIVSITALESVISRNGIIAIFLLRNLAREFKRVNNKTISLTQKHIRGRLAETLIYNKNFYGTKLNGAIDSNLSREELANLSNMTTSNAIRTLSAFAKESIIELHGREITILDEAKLVKISQFGW